MPAAASSSAEHSSLLLCTPGETSMTRGSAGRLDRSSSDPSSTQSSSSLMARQPGGAQGFETREHRTRQVRSSTGKAQWLELRVRVSRSFVHSRGAVGSYGADRGGRVTLHGQHGSTSLRTSDTSGTDPAFRRGVLDRLVRNDGLMVERRDPAQQHG